MVVGGREWSRVVAEARGWSRVVADGRGWSRLVRRWSRSRRAWRAWWARRFRPAGGVGRAGKAEVGPKVLAGVVGRGRYRFREIVQ